MSMKLDVKTKCVDAVEGDKVTFRRNGETLTVFVTFVERWEGVAGITIVVDGSIERIEKKIANFLGVDGEVSANGFVWKPD